LEAVDWQSLAHGTLLGMSGAFYSAEQQAALNQSESRMKKDRKEVASSEPIGIIISRGDKTEPTPVFSAYIWGPVPDAAQDSATRAA
jgi:hypothetical protein